MIQGAITQVLTCEEIDQVSGGDFSFKGFFWGNVVFSVGWDLIGGLGGIGNALVGFDNYMTDYSQRLGDRYLLVSQMHIYHAD
jgi:hypothetical protein